MTYLKKNFFIICLFIYFVAGSFYSLNTGLSFDEYVEQRIWEYNIKLVKHIFFTAELDPMFDGYLWDTMGLAFK